MGVKLQELIDTKIIEEGNDIDWDNNPPMNFFVQNDFLNLKNLHIKKWLYINKLYINKDKRRATWVNNSYDYNCAKSFFNKENHIALYERIRKSCGGFVYQLAKSKSKNHYTSKDNIGRKIKIIKKRAELIPNTIVSVVGINHANNGYYANLLNGATYLIPEEWFDQGVVEWMDQ